MAELDKVYERELENAVGRRPGGRDPREDGAPRRERLGNVDGARSRPGSACSICAARTRRRSARSPTSTSSRPSGPSSPTCSSGTSTSPKPTTTRVNILTRRARLFAERLNRDDEALETWQRVLDIDFANVAALRAIAHVWRTRQDARTSWSARCTRPSIAPRRCSSRRAEADLPRARQDLRRRRSGSRSTPPTPGASCSRSSPGDFEAMAELEKHLPRGGALGRGRRRQDAARRGARRRPTRRFASCSRSPSSGRRRSTTRTRRRPPSRRSSTIEPAHDEAFDALESLHTAAGALGALIELYLNRLETREDVGRDAAICCANRARLRGAARRQEPGVRRAGQRLQRGLRRRRDRALPRAHGAGHERWGELIKPPTAGCSEQTEPKQKIQLCLRLGKWYGEDLGHPEYAQPYYAADPRARPEQRQRAPADGGNSIARRGQWQELGETLHQRARRRGRRRRSQGDPHRARRVARAATWAQPEQGLGYYKRALEVDPLLPAGARGLERIYDGARAAIASSSTSSAQGQGAHGARADRRLPSCASAGLYETIARTTRRSRRRSTARCSRSTAANLLALRGLERVYETPQDWPDLVGVLERSSTSSTTERERIDVLCKLAHDPGGALPQARHRGAAARAGARDRSRPRGARSRRARALLPAPAAVARSDQHLRAAHQRRRSTGRRRSSSTAQIAQVYADEVEDVDRAIDAYRNIVDLDDTNVPALEALAKLYEKQGDAAQAIDFMTRVADLTHGRQAARRDVLPHRQGARREARRPRLRRRSATRWRSISIRRTCRRSAALRAIADRRRGLGPGGALPRSGADATRRRRALARGCSSSSASCATRCSASTTWPCRPTSWRIQCDADNEDAALPLVDEYVAHGAVARRPSRSPRCSSRRAASASAASSTRCTTCSARCTPRSATTRRRSRPTRPRTSSISPTRRRIRGLADVAFQLQDWAGALTNYQKVLTALAEDETEAARRRLLQARLHQARAGPGQAGDQQLREGARRRRRRTGRRSRRWSTSTTSSRTGSRSPPTSGRSSTASSTARSASRCSNEIGDIWAEKREEPAEGDRGARRGARPQAARTTCCSTSCCSSTRRRPDWQQMVDTLQRIADMEEQPERKARYLFTMAQLYRDKLRTTGPRGRAVQRGARSEPELPRGLRAHQQDPHRAEGLEAARARLPQDAPPRRRARGTPTSSTTSGTQLGLIYRDRLQQADAAIEAFKMASRLKPDERSRAPDPRRALRGDRAARTTPSSSTR